LNIEYLLFYPALYGWFTSDRLLPYTPI